MWKLFTVRLQLPVFVVLGVFAAGMYATYHFVSVKKNAELVRMYEAGKKVAAKRQEVINEYLEEITTLKQRKPRVVYYCSGVRPPETSNGASAPEPDRRDLGPLLRATLDELLRCNALRDSLR